MHRDLLLLVHHWNYRPVDVHVYEVARLGRDAGPQRRLGGCDWAINQARLALSDLFQRGPRDLLLPILCVIQVIFLPRADLAHNGN